MTKIDKELLAEFRNKTQCEYCLANCWPCEPHHLWARGMGGGSRLDVRINLIALCRHCHTQTTNGRAPKRDALLRVVAPREGMTVEEIEDELYRLRRTPNAPIAGLGHGQADANHQRDGVSSEAVDDFLGRDGMEAEEDRRGWVGF